MSTANATITAKTGPAISNTAIALANVTLVCFDAPRNVVSFTQSNPSKITEYDLTGVTTATITISGGNLAFAIS